MSDHPIRPMYPDVLGTITGGPRVSMDALQCAIGIFPQRIYLNQPAEVIVILQNMVDQNMQVKVGIQLPTEDKNGKPVIIDTPKKLMTLGMRPGEVGVLRLPIIPRPPTSAAPRIPVRIAVRYRTPAPGQPVRPPSGGAPPSILGVSSFKLQALREVSFVTHTWRNSTDILTTYFEIAPKVMPNLPNEIKPRFESLWSYEEMMEEELQLVEAHLEDTRWLSASITRNSVYLEVLDAVEENFAARELVLHPGEAQAVAKMITYTLDEGLSLEQGFTLEDSRWFQTLCQVVAANESVLDMPRGEVVVRYLFEAALYDAILLAFAVIEPRVKEDLGDRNERLNYANRILNWYAGHDEADISHAYLPLIMGGVVINEIATRQGDNPWTMVYNLREALGGRERLFTGNSSTLLRLMENLLAWEEDQLRRGRVPRPY